jgi:putative CocE/NonD family hydrolase
MGAFELRQLTWTFNAASNSKEAQADPRIKAELEAFDPTKLLNIERGPLEKGKSPLSLVPEYERFYFDMLTKANYQDYWRKIGLCAVDYLDCIPDIPILLLGAWYDSYTRTTSELYIGLSEQKKGPIKLIFGPWVHGWNSLDETFSGEVEFGPDASVKGTGLAQSANNLALRWFDRWLKGIDNGIDNMQPVNYFVMGGGTGGINEDGLMDHGGVWRTSHDWPLPNSVYTKYYLHNDGILSTELPQSGAIPSSYTFDPRNPVPTIGGNISSAHGVMMPGAFDQVERADILGCTPPFLPLAMRKDVLVFETLPLTEKIEVTGPITASLYVSSSARDTDFTLKLIDHYPPNPDFPNGFAMNLSDTIFRARFHSSWEEPELLEPNKIYKLDMISYPSSNIFTKGHKIRVDISSSNYPRFDINPNSGESLGLGKNFVEANQKVFCDSLNPSHIILPLIH